MAFTYDLSTSVGQIRLRIADTIEATHLFSDEELEFFYSSSSTVNGAAIEALRVLLADRARRVRRFADSGLSLDDTAQVDAIRKAIAALGGSGARLSVVDTAPFPGDGSFVEPL